MEKTVIELFAGVGGFRIGLNKVQLINEETIENDNWKFVWANQWEPSTKTQHAFDCYQKRFGDSSCHVNEDIAVFPKSDIPNHSLLVGGFPCQDYSVARSLSGEKGIEGKKGVLFWEIAKILKVKETPFILLENVDRLLKSPSKQRGRDFGVMLRTLHDLGYNAEWRVINAAEYGFAQRRRRVFIFAWLKSLNYNDIANSNAWDIIHKRGLMASAFPIQENQTSINRIINLNDFSDIISISNEFMFNFENTGCMIDGKVETCKTLPIYIKPTPLRDIIEKDKDLSQYYLTVSEEQKFAALRGSKKIPRYLDDGSVYYYSEGSMSPNDDLSLPARTMLTSEGSINRSTHIIPDWVTGKMRFLTPIEAERIQGFPDDWTNTGMPERRRYFMMGNALVTHIVSQFEPFLARIIEAE